MCGLNKENGTMFVSYHTTNDMTEERDEVERWDKYATAGSFSDQCRGYQNSNIVEHLDRHTAALTPILSFVLSNPTV
jgi:hypothetical protein